MKDLRALARKMKVLPGSVEEPLTGKGESVRESPSVGNTVRAGKIPCQKQNTVWVTRRVRANIYATHARHLKKRCRRCRRHVKTWQYTQPVRMARKNKANRTNDRKTLNPVAT